MKVKYVGPSVGVDLLGPDDRAVQVMRGQSIDVPADYGKRLIEQSVWAAVKEKRSTPDNKTKGDQS